MRWNCEECKKDLGIYIIDGYGLDIVCQECYDKALEESKND